MGFKPNNMLQRIQTIYLLLAVGALIAVFFVDIAHFTDETGIHTELGYYTVGQENGESMKPELGMLPVSILSITAALLFFTILQYRNRSLQRTLIRVAYILLILSVVGTWYFVDQNYWVNEPLDPDLSYKVGFYLPAVAIAFSFLASRSIKRDEDLVKSLDRIR